MPVVAQDVRTVGVEEELLLVDAAGDALPIGERVLDATVSCELEHEFKLEQTETATKPCRGIDDLRSQLADRRHAADRAARRVGGRAVALGTSPLPARTHQTPNDRYRRMAAEFGAVAEQQLACAQHVHVGIASRAEGVAVLDRIREWLPVLRALGANSPFWQGIDTSYASYRSVLWGQWPTAGPTGQFGDVAGYDAAVADLIGTGAALDTGMIYFDARLSERFQTVEIRVADMCTELDDALVVAALSRALVHTAADAWRAESRPLSWRTELLRAASWRAARHGLAGQLVDPTSGRLAEAWIVVERLRTHVADALAAAGDDKLVGCGLTRLRERGSGADRQRAVRRRTGDLRAVVAEAVERTLP